MRLRCAVCGTTNVTVTVEAESGVRAMCDGCYQVVMDKARELEASEAAEQRYLMRQIGDEL